MFIKLCKVREHEYQTALLAAATNGEDLMQAMQQLSVAQVEDPSRIGAYLVSKKICTISEIKDAAWKGYNGLMQATCVVQNIQHMLDLPIDKINISDFVMIS